MNKSLQQSLFVWKFFVRAHPDSDLEGVVELIVEETQKETLKTAGEWLESKMFAVPLSGVEWHIRLDQVETLKRGEMPE